MRALTRYENVELILPSTSNTKFNFLDIPQLRSDVEKDIIIRSLETYDVVSMPLSFNGNALPTLAQLQNMFLTLYVDGEESLFRIPMIKLMNVYAVGATNQWTNEINEMNNLQVDWTKSYISLGASFGGGQGQLSVILGVGYERLMPGTMRNIRQQAQQQALQNWQASNNYVTQ